MPKPKKHPSEMTSAELAKDLFHPKLLKGVKAHLKAINTEKPKTVRKSRKRIT